MPDLRIALLGPPEITLDGEPLHVDTRKAIALLAYLAAEGSQRQRDELVALLWPEADSTHGRAALRRTLSSLRRALSGSWLQTGRETAALPRAPGLEIDLERFRTLVEETHQHGHPPPEACPACLPLLQRAVDLHRGDFMAGFGLRDSPEFDDWQILTDQALRRQLATALDRLVAGLAQGGDHDQAIQVAHRRLALDPLHEPAHRTLMELYARAGQRPAAVRQYRECVRVLSQELGVPPLEETTALCRAIEEDRLPPARPAATPPPPAKPEQGPPAFPLVGRSREWQALLAAYQRLGPDVWLAVVEGEAGIGKTRLAEELAAHLASRRAVVLTARSHEGEASLAYGPWVELLRQARALPGATGRLAGAQPAWVGEAARLLPELAQDAAGVPAAPPLESPGARSRFFEGTCQLLVALAGSRPPPLLILDDLHWADQASLELLAYFARRLGSRPVLLLLCWRSEQVGSEHPLRRLVAWAERSGRLTRMELERLDRVAVEELVRASGTKLPAEALLAETEGNPYFLVEYLTAVEEVGQLALPPTVRELLRSRLTGLTELGRQILTTAAVIGRSFDFDVTRAASGRSEEEAVAGLEELLRRGLIREVPAATGAPLYDFSHAQLRRLVYGQTTLARRRLLHRRVARAVGATSGGQRQAAQIAAHYQEAGQDQQAALAFQRAGEQARELYANREALAHFEAAMGLGHPRPALLHEAIGDLQTRLGLYEEALLSYQAAAATHGEAELGRVEHKLGLVHHRRGDWAAAARHFEEALPAAAAAGERARVCADWSLTLHHAGQGDEAWRLAARALELAEEAGQERALAQVHNLMGVLARGRSDGREARDHLTRSLELARRLGDPEAEVAALNNLALANRDAGRLEEALVLTRQALRLCARLGDRHREAALHSNLADLLHATGQGEEAMEHLKRSASLYGEIGGAREGGWQPQIWMLAEW